MLPWQQNPDEPLWVYPIKNDEWRDQIVKEFQIHPVTAQILVSRKFSSLEQIHDYLYAKLPDLQDPFLINGMDKAVHRICQAIQQKQNILIYGDNDVDGMTGTALLVEFLQYIGARAFFYVSSPGSSRQNLIIESLEYAIRNECKLLITVDCGITAAPEIARLTENNIDVIITDHHEPSEQIPKCVAILNPKLCPNSTYNNRDLTGVGVAFKLAHAITKQLVADGIISPKKVDLKRYLDLVALGTISDMGALLGENRILVRYGLRQLRKTKRIGLAKLISISDPELEMGEVSAYTVASKIAPRLNSLGRIDDPKKGVELLLVRNAQVAEKMALELDLNNIERQRIERTMSNELEVKVSTNPELLQNKAIVMSSDTWHPGIIAILSTRISKYYNRPTIMISVEGGIGKGSVRSIPEFPVLAVLKECSDLLLNYGGHDLAAGLTIKIENIPEFTARFTEAAKGRLSNQDVMNKLHIDAEVHLRDLTFDLMESISLLAPYGNENPQPLLHCVAKQAWPPKIVGKNHLKLYLEELEDPGLVIEGIAFGRSQANESLRRKNIQLEVAFTPQINNYLGPSIQLLVRDFKIHPLVVQPPLPTINTAPAA